jgi:hypothetical protein
MPPPAKPTKHIKPTMSVARLRKKASGRPPLWQYGLLVGLFVFCFALAIKVVINQSGRSPASPVITAPAITATPPAATAAASATVPSLQPAGVVSAVPTTATTVGISTVPMYTPTPLTYSAGSAPTPLSTVNAGFGVATSTPATTMGQTVPSSPLRRRPLAAADKG